MASCQLKHGVVMYLLKLLSANVKQESLKSVLMMRKSRLKLTRCLSAD